MGNTILQLQASRTAGRIAGRPQAGPATSIRRLLAGIRSAWRTRRSIDELMALDDHELADIGLTRGAVEYAVRHGRLPSRDR